LLEVTDPNRLEEHLAVIRITVHQPLKGQLDCADQPVELVDEAGNRLGHFVPRSLAETDDACPYSAEELHQMRNAIGGRTLQEIWTSLGAK
jgi:hypothetical protein